MFVKGGGGGGEEPTWLCLSTRSQTTHMLFKQRMIEAPTVAQRGVFFHFLPPFLSLSLSFVQGWRRAVEVLSGCCDLGKLRKEKRGVMGEEARHDVRSREGSDGGQTS
jgi:hypothetical protein